MPYRRNYPQTVAEVIDLDKKYRPDALRVVRALARSKPWRGTLRQRKRKLAEANRGLAAAYGLRVPQLRYAGIGKYAGNGFYDPQQHLICLSGRLSVVTFLHEFAHARGMDERQACRWSINLFRRVFSLSFSRCQFIGHMLIRTP